MELLTSLLPRLLLIWLLPPESLLLLLAVSEVTAVVVLEATADEVVTDVGVLLHDCIFLWRYSLMESFRFGVTDAGGSGVVNAGFNLGSELAVLVKIFGYAVAVDPSVDRLSVTLVDESRKELLTRSELRSVPREEKLDGRVLENPLSKRELISLDALYWKVLLLLPLLLVAVVLPLNEDFG